VAEQLRGVVRRVDAPPLEFDADGPLRERPEDIDGRTGYPVFGLSLAWAPLVKRVAEACVHVVGELAHEFGHRWRRSKA
jgi:hypothetical protein